MSKINIHPIFYFFAVIGLIATILQFTGNLPNYQTPTESTMSGTLTEIKGGELYIQSSTHQRHIVCINYNNDNYNYNGLVGESIIVTYINSSSWNCPEIKNLKIK